MVYSNESYRKSPDSKAGCHRILVLGRWQCKKATAFKLWLGAFLKVFGWLLWKAKDAGTDECLVWSSRAFPVFLCNSNFLSSHLQVHSCFLTLSCWCSAESLSSSWNSHLDSLPARAALVSGRLAPCSKVRGAILSLVTSGNAFTTCTLWVPMSCIQTFVHTFVFKHRLHVGV